MAAPKSSIHTPEAVSCVEFCPFKDSSDLLAVGCKSRVIVKACSLQDPILSEPGQNMLDSITFEDLVGVSCGSDIRVASIAWSPLTAFNGNVANSKFVFSVCGVGSAILLYFIEPGATSSQILPGHTPYVNGLCHHPTDPALLASVGDDNHCRLWDVSTGQLKSKFRLRSPGVDVRWHPEDPVKLLVAEKGGRIRLYDLSTEVPIQSLDTPTSPLISADWSPTNCLVVGGVGASEYYIWDLSKSSQPLARKSICQGYANKFRWCAQSEAVFATIGLNSQVKVHHIGHQKVPISCDLPIATHLSWHARLPVMGVASDQHVHLWTAET